MDNVAIAKRLADLNPVMLTAKANYRSLNVTDLVCHKLALEQEADNIRAFPDDYALAFEVDTSVIASWAATHDRLVAQVQAELDRRRNIKAVALPNQDSLQAIKGAIGGKGLADIIGWYTQVETHQGRWTFTCPLHPDKHPSGVIYIDEGRWHCFQCGEHGDCFDAVMKFGRVDFREALARLARYTGIELREKRHPQAGNVRGIAL